MRRLQGKAGLPNIRFHDLRLTAATLMLRQDVHPEVVQERLGHADISLRLNTDSHVQEGMQDEAAAKLDEVLMPVEVTEALRPKVAAQLAGKDDPPK